jgi:predicted ATPase/DNA-binding SARP family transcriptional activator
MTAAPEVPAEVRFRVLGPLEYAGGVTGSALGGRRQRSLLAMLIARAGKVITGDALVEAVWGEDAPSRPLSSVQTYVSSLRRAIAEPIEHTGIGYRLEAPPEAVDSAVFERLLETAETDLERDPQVAADLLDRALGLWRGRAFEDVADAPGLRLEAGRLDELRVVALEARMRAGLACGDTTGLAADMEPWLEIHMLRESFVALFVSILAAEERQAEALRVLGKTRTMLLEELGVSLGPSLQKLEDQLLQQDPAVVGVRSERGLTRRRHNLPTEGSSFHGRQDDVARVLESLSGSRLVTLVGPGGTGKTRMAIEAGLEIIDTVHDGVWFVDLTSADSLGDVWRELAAALPLSIVNSHQPPRNVVLEDLDARELAIILDNCEHVIEAAAAVVSEIHAAAPSIRVLATSRVPLHLRAEMVIRLQPLSTPLRDAEAGEAAHSPSVQLFADRARAAGHVEFTQDDVVVVGEICRRLDGLPLAIELAAAMTAVLTPTQIAERLASSATDVVSRDRDRPQRHSSLTETVMWSYELLSDIERQVFVRLAIFAGGFEFADAVDVCADQHISKQAVADALARLVDASLVIPVRRDKTNRYTMLETVRTQAAGMLADLPSLDDLTRRHAERFVGLADQGYARASGAAGTDVGAEPAPDATDWVVLLESNRPNLRQAFEWWLTHDAGRAQLLAGSLTWLWERRNLVPEGVEMLQAALDASSTRSAGRLRAQLGLARLTMPDDPTYANEMLLEVVEGAEHFGLRFELWHARFNIGLTAMLEDDPERAQAAFEEIHRWASGAGEHNFLASACRELAHVSLSRRDVDEARSLASEGLAAAERSGSSRVTAHCLETKGWVELAAGQLDGAQRAFEGALRLENDTWSIIGLPVRLGMAAVACAAGDLSAAVRHTQDALTNIEETQHFYVSHVDYVLVIAACIHAASGNIERAAALKSLESRQTVWGRREPMSGWLAAVGEPAGASTIQYPTRLDSLREILSLDEVLESS